MAAPKNEQTICVSCGFCCDGTLFEHAHLSPGEKGNLPPKMEESWFMLGERECFRLPCWYFKGKCSIYKQKKARMCHDFRCKLLVSFSERHISLNDALQIVRNARMLRGQLMDTAIDHQNLGEATTFRQLINTLREVKNTPEGDALARDPEHALLQARCNILEALLTRYFKPDKDFVSMIDTTQLKDPGEEASEKMIQLRKLKYLLEVTKKLSADGIWFMILKGPLLSQRIFGDPCRRKYGDFDLLVNETAVEKAIGLLISMGFQPVYFQWPDKTSLKKRVLRYHNQYLMVWPDQEIHLEVHWRLFKHNLLPGQIQQAWLSRGLEQTTLGGQVFFQFRNETEMLYLILHGSVHGWSRKKWLEDVHHFLDRYPIQDKAFLTLAGEIKAWRTIALCNALLEHVYPGAAKLPVTQKVKPYLFRHALRCMEGEEQIPPRHFMGFMRRQKYRIMLKPGLRYIISTFNFSQFTQTELNRKWLPPIGLLVFFRRFVDIIFSREGHGNETKKN